MPTTDARTNRRAEAEARFARGPHPAASNEATPEALRELQVHQIELEMQNKEVRRAMQGMALAALGTIRKSLRGAEALVDPEAGRQHFEAATAG
jgi:hypothetical protein